MSGMTSLSWMPFDRRILWAVSPAIAVGALSIITRVTTGAFAFGYKNLGSLIYLDDPETRKEVDETADYIMSYATRGFGLELKAGLGLTAISAGVIGLSVILGVPLVDAKDKVVANVANQIPLNNQTNVVPPEDRTFIQEIFDMLGLGNVYGTLKGLGGWVFEKISYAEEDLLFAQLLERSR
jgi:hypothetical protein